ncbi:MAG: hypothetical protein RL721_2405 [Candidatus Eisenbacteria bacterium]
MPATRTRSVPIVATAPSAPLGDRTNRSPVSAAASSDDRSTVSASLRAGERRVATSRHPSPSRA